MGDDRRTKKFATENAQADPKKQSVPGISLPTGGGALRGGGLNTIMAT
jgi:hypothetical protein